MSLIGIGGFNGVSGKAYFGNIYSSSMEHPENQITGGSTSNRNVKIVERGTYSYGGKTGEGTIFSIITRTQPKFNLTNPFPQEQTTYAFLADCANNSECPTGYKCCLSTNYTNYGTIKGNACIKDNPQVYLDKMGLVLNVTNQGMYDLEKLWAMEATKAKNANDSCKYQVAIANLNTIHQAMAMRVGLTPKIDITPIQSPSVPSLQPAQQPPIPGGLQPATQPGKPGAGQASMQPTTTTTPSVQVITETTPATDNTKKIMVIAVVAVVIAGLVGYSLYSLRK